jgi:uncharacterized protein
MYTRRTVRTACFIALAGGLAATAGGCGEQGPQGAGGLPGKDGAPGTDGTDGADGAEGPKGDQGDPAPPKTNAANLADFIKERVELYATAALPEGEQFPLHAAATDSIRTLAGVRSDIVISWLDPLKFDAAPDAPRFGANNDYIAYFGEGWDAVAGDPPQWHGAATAGWIWVNHEYISHDPPTPTSAPTGQQLFFAKHLRALGVLTNDVESSVWSQADIDTYIRWAKKQLGGTWMRIVQDPSSGAWTVDRGANALRYDATSRTQLRITGHSLAGHDHDDETGAPLPEGVVSGIMGDCAGGMTPWGTVITAEENVQDYYGDLEACWSSDQKFLTGKGFDPGAPVAPVLEASASSAFGAISDPNGRHARDGYGYLSEIDPGLPAAEYEGSVAPGAGHKKLGVMGRVRWEAGTIAVDGDWKLVPGEPITLYGSDDRRGGRIYKFVSAGAVTAGMTRAETRALLDDGKLYVAHFAGLDNATGNTMLATGAAPTEREPGAGRWIELSTGSADIAPNAAALRSPMTTVGAALQDVRWNGIGGFPTDDAVRRALLTASNKIGVVELNRPEDIEYNPRDLSGNARIYVTFSNHNKRNSLNQDGVLIDPAVQPSSPRRADQVGAVYAIQESDPASPGASLTFQFFEVWHGSSAGGEFDAACPDNLIVDRDGGVWFGTDGNYWSNDAADAIYYLDLDPAHRAGAAGVVVPSFGKAFRVLALPSDAEATGPTLSSDMSTLFVSVQHPGEDIYSAWPKADSSGSSVIAVSFVPE